MSAGNSSLGQAAGRTDSGFASAGHPRRLAPNLFYLPLRNTMAIGVVVAAACVLTGGLLAWLVVMTDVPMCRTLGVLATLPFMIPSFATALAWGMLPTVVVLSLHYLSLAYRTITRFNPNR